MIIPSKPLVTDNFAIDPFLQLSAPALTNQHSPLDVHITIHRDTQNVIARF